MSSALTEEEKRRSTAPSVQPQPQANNFEHKNKARECRKGVSQTVDTCHISNLHLI
jgi:hypothetical protein